MAQMIRTLLALSFFFCGATAFAQVPIYQALPQPPAVSAYPQAFPGAYSGAGYGGFAPYGYGGYGYRGYGYGYAPYGFGARGYYPPNPYGNMNWLPPNPPSPYYVVPSGKEYLEQARRRDESTYTELLLFHNLTH